MNIDLNTFRRYSNVNYQSKTNLILNEEGNGLTTTKARGGVNMLAGLMNIGRRAQYGRDTLEALKDSLISEFKAQTKLSDQQCMDSVNTAFKEAFAMDFNRAKSKAIKLNSKMLRNVLNAADSQMKANMAPVDTQSAKSMIIDKLINNSFITDTYGQKILTKDFGKDKYGYWFATFTDNILPKIKNDLNTVVVTKESAKFIIEKLKDHITNTKQLLNGEGKSETFDEQDAKLPKLDDMKNDILARLDARIAELQKIQ